MQRQNVLRKFLFVVFFGVGAAAMVGSMLYVDLLQYYHNKQRLKVTEESPARLESLNADYDALLEQLEKDSNLIERLGPATLGTEPVDANTVYPKATAEQLAAARKTLAEDSSPEAAEPLMPDWIIRCSKPRRRTILFLSGAFLILISFICFGSAGQRSRKEPAS